MAPGRIPGARAIVNGDVKDFYKVRGNRGRTSESNDKRVVIHPRAAGDERPRST